MPVSDTNQAGASRPKRRVPKAAPKREQAKPAAKQADAPFRFLDKPSREVKKKKEAARKKFPYDFSNGQQLEHKKHGGLSLATIVANPTAALHSAARIAEAAVAPSATITAALIGGTPKKIADNAAKDVVDIPLNMPASLYHLGDTAIHDPKKAAELLAQPYIDAAKHPVKSFVDHPVGTGLLFAGPKGVGGRTAGAVMRTGKLGERAAKLASTERAPRVVPGTGLAEHRRYSPDVTAKAVQVLTERARGRKGHSTAVMPDHEIRRRVDEFEHAREHGIRRAHVQETGTAARNILHNIEKPTGSPKQRLEIALANRNARIKPTAATSLAVQGVARTTPELQALLAHYEREAATLKGRELHANKTAQKQIREALKGEDMPATHAPVVHELPGPENPGGIPDLPHDGGALPSLHAANVTFDGTSKAALTGVKRFTHEINLPLQDRMVELGLLDKNQALGARLVNYATLKMGAHHDGERIIGRDGHELSHEEILAHMQAHGEDLPGFVTNAPNRRGRTNFYVDQHGPPVMSKKIRTGKGMAKGLTDLHPDTLVEGAVRARGLIDAAETHGAFMHEFAMHDPAGKPVEFTSYSRAEKAAADRMFDEHGDPIPGAVKLRPVLLAPFGANKGQLAATLEHASHDEGAMAHLHQTMQHAVSAHIPHDSKGIWTLVPDAAADQRWQHLRATGAGGLGKTANLLGSQFRTTVLATNPKWLVGNVAEAGFRATVAKAGPTSYFGAKKSIAALEKIDPELATALRSRVTGGGHFSMNRQLKTYSGADRFADTRLAPVATALGKFWQLPGPKWVAGGWHEYTNVVFNHINAPIERRVQTAMLGKAMKDAGLMPRHVVKLSDEAALDAARGLTDTNAQVALGRAVDEMYGKYGKFSPNMRKSISTLTPFIPWSLNAITFLTKVLPRDHPVLLSLMASASIATEDWRAAHGEQFGAEGALPVFLQGSVPTPGGHLPIGRYLPTGVSASESGPLGVLADSVLPQFKSSAFNLLGKDWKLDDLKPGQHPVTEAVKSLVEGTVPIVGQADRISHNPGGKVAKFRKTLDPTYAIPTSTRGKKGGGISGAGMAGISQSELDSLPAATETITISQSELDSLPTIGGTP